VDQTIALEGIEQTLIFSSPMAQYLERHPQLRVIADFVDVDSDKWRQYAAGKFWPMSWIYRREADKLLAFERQVAARTDATLLVSEREAQLFQGLAPESADKIGYVNNGVDCLYFDAEATYLSPYPDRQPVIVFTGVMDYWANVDAVCWFAKQVLPLIKQHLPAVRFYIVGSKPNKAVLQLAANDPVIVVTGRVDDVRPYLAHAQVAVAPLRIARGVQNKVLEAMAMAKSVVATSAAMAGIADNLQLQSVWVEDQPQGFADRVLACLAQAESRSQDNRNFVLSSFSWQQSAEQLFEILESGGNH
jgi:sugar transferase (PEP-CTERM/EpsH1 system associated)